METNKVYLNKNDVTVYGVREPMPIQIVCGDCSGRANGTGDIELLPLRTFLGVDGRCYTCGGRSYVIASELCGQLRRTITERRSKFVASQSAAPGGWSPRIDEFWKGKPSNEAQ
jgi:hypothetical protein